MIPTSPPTFHPPADSLDAGLAAGFAAASTAAKHAHGFAQQHR
jgi:hypothetical protein